ncbi:MAG: N-acetylmuramoyl-L-alanine amidase [Oscillospiraceae bacterium]
MYQTLGSIWQKPDRRGSSHYGINGNNVGQYVKESDIAWTDGNWESNRRSVTIETANSTGDPTWEIAGASFNTLVKLVADIARRNNFGTLVKGQNVTWHSMYSATQCPGPDLLRLMDSIVSEANTINAEGPSEIVYLRKNNSEMFLGADASNRVNYVNQNSAKAWKMTGINGKFTFSDFNNPSLKLQAASDGVTPLLAQVTSASKLAYGEYVNGKLKIFIEGAISTFTATMATSKLFMSTMAFPQGAGYSSDESNSTNFDAQSDIDVSTSTSKPSTIPSEILPLVGKSIKIKHKSTGMYLSHKEETHPTGTGKMLRLNSKSTNLEQVWTISDLGAGVYGIVSNTNKNCALEMECTYNNCVSGTEGSSQPWKRGISIEGAGNNSYKLKFTVQNKYISAYTYQYDTLLNATNSSSQVWEFEEHINYLTYPTKVMNISQRHDGS